MSDVFLSYASQDRERAREIAALLEARGLSVWWDRVIPPGRVYDEVIQEALNSARCVVVLWSEHSVRSNWVKVEAEEASNRGVLVPALIDHVAQPMQFKRIQAANLADWDGSETHPEFRSLRASIDRLLGRPVPAAPAPARFRPASASSGTRQMALGAAAGAAAVLAIGLGVWAIWGRDASTGAGPADAPQSHVSASATTAPAAADGAPAGGGGARDAAPPPVRRGTLINLVAPENGGEMITAEHEDWSKSVDGDESTGLWVSYGGRSEAVFGFKDGGYATVERLEILVPAASMNNVGELEVLVGNDPQGLFESVVVAKPRNMLIVKERYQQFPFTPRTARYVKVRVLKPAVENYSISLNEWRLLGTLQ